MNKTSAVTVFFLSTLLFLSTIFFVHAAFYPTKGYDNGASYNQPFSQIATPFVDYDLQPTGSSTEPLVGDLNGDGQLEMLISDNAGVTMYNKNFVAIDTINAGTGLRGNPVLCDINNDGHQDYVGIYYNGTATNIIALGMTAPIDGNHFTVISSAIIDPVNDTANLVCSKFEIKHGDNKNHVLWLDNDKFLWQASMTGSTINADRRDVLGNGLSLPTANSEHVNFDHGALGSYQLVTSTTFDPGGEPTVMFASGRAVYEYDGGCQTTYPISCGQGVFVTTDAKFFTHISSVWGGSAFDNFTTTPNGVEADMLSIQLIDGLPNNRLGVLYSGSRGTGGGFNPHNIVGVIHMSRNFLGGVSMVVDGTQDVTVAGMSNSGNSRLWSAIALGDYNGDGQKDLYVMTFSNHVYVVANGAPSLTVITTNNMSTIVQDQFLGQATGQAALDTLCRGAGATEVSPILDSKPKFFLTNLFGSSTAPNGRRDILISYGHRQCVVGFDAESNYTFTPTSYGELGTLTASSEYDFNTPTPIDPTSTGSAELLYMNPFRTHVWQSSQFGQTAQTFPFHLSLESINNLSSTTRVTADYDPTRDNYEYNYALACNIGQSTIFNEQFRLGYNFSVENVSLNVFPPESFLTAGGLLFHINTTFPQFDLYKTGNEGVRDTTTVNVFYQTTDNIDLIFIAYASDTQQTYKIELNKTGTNVKVNKLIFGNAPINLFNFTTSGSIPLQIIFTPKTDQGTNIQYYTTAFMINNVTLGTDSTFQFSGTDIKDIELFSSTNGTLEINSIGYFKSKNVYPVFSQFQNGQRIVSGGVTVENPSPDSPSLIGDGFTVVPDFNNIFFGVCNYQGAGTYTQRHYLTAINQFGDYTNFKDIQVTITGQSTTFANSTTTTGDAGQDTLNSFLNFIGFTSTGSKLLLWLFLMILLTAIALVFHWFLGAIVFLILLIIGVYYGVVPLWIVIVLVLLAAGGGAVLFRKLFSGGE